MEIYPILTRILPANYNVFFLEFYFEELQLHLNIEDVSSNHMEESENVQEISKKRTVGKSIRSEKLLLREKRPKALNPKSKSIEDDHLKTYHTKFL